MAKKKKQNIETEEQKFKRISSGNYNVEDSAYVGSKSTGKMSINQANALLEESRRKRQEEINNRSAIEWLNLADKSKATLNKAKSDYNVALNNYINNDENAFSGSLQSKGLLSDKTNKNALIKSINNNTLVDSSNIRKNIPLANRNFQNTDSGKTLLSNIHKAQEENAYNQSNLERKMAEEDVKNAGILGKAGYSVMAGLSDLGSFLRSDLQGEDYRYSSYGENLQSEIADNSSWIGKIGYGAISGATKLLASSALGNVGSLAYFLDGVDDSYNSAKTRGYSDNASRIYGVTVGSLDFIFNEMIGSVATSLTKGKLTKSEGGLIEKAVDPIFSKVFKNVGAKEMAQTLFSEGAEEWSQEYIERFLEHTILEVADKGEQFDLGKVFNSETHKQALESFLIGASIGGIMKSYQNIATPKDVKSVNQAIYTAERTNGVQLSDYNKNLISNIAQKYEESDIEADGQMIYDTFESIKQSQRDAFQNSALDLFPNLDENSQKLYNDLINDVSDLMYNTGVNVKFDPNLDIVSEWQGDNLILNPTLTDTPIKTLLLKELGAKLLDNNTKQSILSYVKENGLYDTLKQQLLDSGDFDSANVNDEIISITLNDILNDPNKITNIAQENQSFIDKVKGAIDNLADKMTNNRTTKDAVFFNNLSNTLNNLKLDQNNISGEELSTREIDNISDIEAEESTQNQLNTATNVKQSIYDKGTYKEDVNKYKGAGKDTIQNAMNSELIDGTKQASRFIDTLAKISDEKGLVFDFTNNEKLVKDKLSLKNKIVNGYINNGKIVINLDSPRALNTIVGHEITHALENSKYYKELQKALFDYAKTNGEYNDRLADIKELYKGIKNADIKRELTADLAGDYLFTNKEFVESLSKTNKNMFVRIFDELRYIWRQLFGTKEQKQMDKAMKNYIEAYNDNVAVKSGFDYSLSDVSTMRDEYNLFAEPKMNNKYDTRLEDALPQDNNGNQLSEGQFNKYKDSVTVDDDGYLIVGYHNADRFAPFYSFKPGNVQNGSQYAIWLTDSQIMGKTYSYVQNIPYTKQVKSVEEAKSLLEAYSDNRFTLEKVNAEDYLKNNNNWEYVGITNKYKDIHNKETLEKIENDNKRGLITSTEYKMAKAIATDADVYVVARTDGEQFDMYDEDKKHIYYDDEDVKKNIRTYFRGAYSGYTYPVYMNIKKPYIVETDGRLWKYAEQHIDNKKVDEFKEILNDRKKIDNIIDLVNKSRDEYEKNNEVLSSFGKVDFNLMYNTSNEHEYKYYNYAALRNYLQDYKLREFDNYQDLLERAGDGYNFPPADMKVRDMFNNDVDPIILEKYGDMTIEEYYNYVKYFYENNEASYPQAYFYKNAVKELGLTNLEGRDIIELYDYDLMKDSYNDEKIIQKFTKNLKTDLVVQKILESNEKGETDYDGVIFKNIKDPGQYANEYELDDLLGNVYVVFNSNQIDFIDNKNPTDDPDLSYSLSQQTKEYGDYNVYGKDIKVNPLIKQATQKQAKSNETKQKEVVRETTDENRKVRKTYDSIIKSDNQTEQAKKISEKLMGLDTYIPDSNKNQIERADEHINKYGVEESLSGLKQNVEDKGKLDVNDIAIGERLIEYYSKTGDEKNLAEAIQLTAMAGTIAGRSVQAMSMINRQTPTGQVTWIQRSIDRMNKQMKEAYDKSKLPGKKLQQFEFTPEMQQKILNSTEANLEDNLNEVYKELGEQVQMSKMEALDSWRYFAMLSSPTTHIRNIVGNLLMGKMQQVKNVIKGGIEDTYYVITGKKGERTNTLKKASKKYVDFAKNDIDNVKGQLGIGENKYTNPKTQLQKNMRMFSDTKVGRQLEKFVKKGLIDTTSNLLETEDVWGLKSAYTKSMSQYLYANKIDLNSITDKQLAQARQFAVDQAKQATFHQDSALASALNTLENKSLAAKLVIGGIVPFKKTPFNVAKTSLEYNPVGLMKTLTYDSYRLYNGQITANQYIDNLAKGLTGTGIALLGFALANAGHIRTTGDDDESYDEDKGIQPYSIVLGDKTISLDWLSPTAVPLFVGAELYHQFDIQNNDMTEEEKNKGLVDLLNASVSSLNPVSEMTMLSGIQSALKTYSGDYAKALEEIGTNTIKTYASQFTPSILGKIARTTDPYERTTTTTKKTTIEKAVDSFINQVKSKVPGLRQTLPVKTDVWGNEIKQEQNPLLRGVYNLTSPATVKSIRDTELDREVERLYDSTGNKLVIPKTYIDKYFTYGDKEYRLNNKEYSDYKKAIGVNNYDTLSNLIKSNEYKSLSDEQKVEIISQVYSYNKSLSKDAYSKINNISYTPSSTYNAQRKSIMLGGKIEDYLLYNLQDFKADYDKNGKVISGSKKDKIINYLNKSDMNYNQKLYLLAKDYAVSSEEKTYLAYLINDSSLNKDEKLELYKSLTGFKVSSDGTVRW